MNKRLYYLNLLSLLNEAAKELNILDLEERETVLLSHIWKHTSEGKNNYTAYYSEFAESYGKASKSGFVKSLRILRKHNLIKKSATLETGFTHSISVKCSAENISRGSASF